VQSVAVRLVVEREREIEAFEPVEYWTLEANLSQPSKAKVKPRPYFPAKLWRLNGEEPALHSEADVTPHLSVLERATWTVGEVKLGTRQRNPAAPFTTSTLQQEASRKLGFGTSKTMRIAQQLYEGVDIGDEGTTGLITYMRTDSVSVSQEAQAEAQRYIDQRYGREFRPDQPPIYRTKSKTAQEAHEAVRPTSVMRSPSQLRNNLSRDQIRLYELIWLRFVASQMAPAVYDTVRAEIYAGEAKVAVAKRPYHFRATGSTLRFAGFLAVYEETAPDDRPDDDQIQVPSDLTANELLDLLELLPQQHFTQAPPRFSEATLVKALEENGVGRPSTYASIIETVQHRGYVEAAEKRLVPTDTGRLVNDLLVDYFPDVLSVDFTARLEDELDAIAHGDKEWVPVIDGFYRNFAERLAVADEKLEKVDLKTEPEFVGRDCPTCEVGQLLYREGRFGRFIGCNRFPACRHTEQIIVSTGVTCAKGGEIIEKKTRKGKTFYGCVRYPECSFTSWKPPVSADEQGIWVQVNKGTTECVACGFGVEPKVEEKKGKGKVKSKK
jgi:DNA topoisomerase-1